MTGTRSPYDVIITKPQAQAQRWLDALAENDWSARAMPLLALEMLPETPARRSVWLNLDQYSGVVMVSPQAARCCADALDTYWPQPPMGVQWLCNGNGTAQALLEHYPMSDALAIHYPDTGNQAEDVLALPPMQQVSGEKWLLVAGEGGRTITADTLTDKGASVTRLAVYRRHKVALPAAALESLAAPEAIIQISSLLALESLTSQAPLVTKQLARLLVSSPRLAAAAEQHGWQHIIQANGASLDATLSALARHASHPATQTGRNQS